MDKPIEKKHVLQRKHLPYVALAVVILALAVRLLPGSHAGTMRVERANLTVSEVTCGEFNDYVRLTGRVAPIRVVQITPEEGGIVREKVVEEGATVRQGDVILRLDNSNLDLQILNAEAELAEKQNLLRNTLVVMEQDRLNNRTEEATLDMDVERKQRACRRNERLYAERLISEEECVQSREDYELARRKRDLVARRLRQDSIYRSVQMDQMEDNLVNMRRNVLLIRERRDKLEVKAAIDGELGLLDVTPGQSVQAGTMVGQINDLSGFKIEAEVDEHYIDRVRTGLSADFTREGKTYSLVVRKVYPEVRRGKFRIELAFRGERAENLRIGQTCYVNLVLGKPGQAVLLPRGAFFQSTGGNWVFVLDAAGDKAYRRAIRIGRQNAQYYEVLDGLQPGERVITNAYEAYGDNEVLKIK